MLTKRSTQIAIVIAVIAVAAITASFAVSPRASRQNDDYALRHLGGLWPAVLPAQYYAGSDYSLRHPELSQSTMPIDTTDYYFRHPELSQSVDKTDYALRHPELSAVTQPLDTSDYALRHPELSGQ